MYVEAAKPTGLYMSSQIRYGSRDFASEHKTEAKRTAYTLSTVYTIQPAAKSVVIPVVKPVVKPFSQQVVSCIQTFNRLSNLFDKRFDKPV